MTKKERLLIFIDKIPEKYKKGLSYHKGSSYELIEIGKIVSKKLELNIHGDYIFKLPYTPSELDSITNYLYKYEDKLEIYLDLLFSYLSEINDLSILESLYHKDLRNKIKVINGILSAFSIDDIVFFIEKYPMNMYGRFTLNGYYDEEYSLLMDFVSKYINLSYFPSKKTLIKILNHITK